MQPDSSNRNLVRHVALLTSRPVYWTVVPTYLTALKHADGVAGLLRWALSFPKASLGIDPRGIGLILRSIYELNRESMDQETEDMLHQIGISNTEIVLSRYDLEVWNSERERLRALLSRAQRAEYVWVDRENAEWWIKKTEQAFQNYANLCGRDESPLLRLFIRHRCVVFAPFDAQHALKSLQLSPLAHLEKGQGNKMNTLQRAISRYKLMELSETISPIYFSWRLVDFSVSKDDLVYQPMLALWNYWPANRRWAPPASSKESPEASPLKVEEAASLLEDVLWEKVETIFAIARQTHEIGFAEPEFAGKEVSSPVFYFVTPTELPTRAENYVEEYRSLLYPLVKTCLGSDDPFSMEVAWGTLEGNLLTLRHERTSQKGVRAWYLVLPFAPRALSPDELERDLDFISDKLTFLEFSIGHEARDIDTDIREFATRYARWGGSLDGVSEQVSQFLKLFPLARPEGRNKMKMEMTRLLLLLHRISALLEKTNSDAQQTLRKFNGYLDATEDFFRRAFTYASLGEIKQSLQDAILDAYPYHYLQQPGRSLENMIETVSINLHGLLETAEKGLEQIERSDRESQIRWTRMLSLLVGALALLIALPQFVPGSVITPDTYPHWLKAVLPLPMLEVLVRASVGIIIGWLILGSMSYALYRVWRYFVSPEELTSRQIRNLWELVERATSLVQEARSQRTRLSHEEIQTRLEQMDEEASTLLCRIFDTLHQMERSSHNRARIPHHLRHVWKELLWGPGISEWVERNVRLRHLMALFDLRPDNIPLPRTLCLLHYKGAEFQSRSSISDWEFERSLRLAGFSSSEADRLREWLSHPVNQIIVENLGYQPFLDLMKKYGVTVEESKRDENQWKGPIHK
ncbi:MAG: hypothetical protein WHS87_11905 [Anaerolineales bacterium]